MGFQMIGDWAKGEFLNAGKNPGEGFLCFRLPGTQVQITFNADQFAMLDQGGDLSAEQAAVASAFPPLTFQVAFNKVKRSLPARTDVVGSDLDACGQQGMKDLAAAASSGNLCGSMAHGHATTTVKERTTAVEIAQEERTS